MKRVLKRLREMRVGDSTLSIGSVIIFCKNEEAWTGRISDKGTVRNGKTFYFIKDAVSDNGKVQSFDIESKDIIKGITELEMEYGFYR
jgi:hypothetical protein